MKARKLSDDQIKWVCTQYGLGYSINEIGRTLVRSGENIRQYLIQSGIDRRDRSSCQRFYSFNENFFDTIDTEHKAYWLGFLAADASVQPERRGLFVNLNPKDSNHLQSLANDLESDFPLYYYSSHNGRYQNVRFTVTSAHLITVLERHGVTARKTFTLKWPALPVELYAHLIRGYVDGDGCYIAHGGHIRFKVTGNEPFIRKLQSYLIDKCDLQPIRLLRPNQGRPVCYLCYHGNRQVIRIANHLYEGATIYLSRKRDLALTHYQSLIEYSNQLRFC